MSKHVNVTEIVGFLNLLCKVLKIYGLVRESALKSAVPCFIAVANIQIRGRNIICVHAYV